MSLKDAGLTFDELARHAAQEVVDLVEYLGAMSEAGSHPELWWALRRARSLRETLCDIAGPAPTGDRGIRFLVSGSVHYRRTIHVPAPGGPMTPDLLDELYDDAREAFAREAGCRLDDVVNLDATLITDETP